MLPRLDNAVAVDLPSHGNDMTLIADVTLDLYVYAVIKQIEKAEKPVVLIGHSAAGVVIEPVAERIPDRIVRLVCICAYAPKNGDALHQMRRRAQRQLVLPAVTKSDDGLSYTIDLKLGDGIFYHDCPPEAVAFALENLGPQPILPQETPVKLGVNYDSVPRSFILGTEDHAVPPEDQERMIADCPPEDIHRMHFGHSPFFSHPEALVRILDEITGW